MTKIAHALVEFFRIVSRRFRTQGFFTTLQWMRDDWSGLDHRGACRCASAGSAPNILIGPQYGRFGKATLEEAGVTASSQYAGRIR